MVQATMDCTFYHLYLSSYVRHSCQEAALELGLVLPSIVSSCYQLEQILLPHQVEAHFVTLRSRKDYCSST